MPELSEITDALAANRTRFLDLVEEIRPRLHRYCSRMVGSVLDGEDLVQDVLAQVYFKLSLLKTDRPIEPWLFRIAHNRCIDFLRRQRAVTVPFDEDHDDPVSPPDEAELGDEVAHALRRLVTVLPPKERACVVLKDVLDYPLASIAEIVDSTVGGVKAALHRGRSKLRATSEDPPSQPPRRHTDPTLLHEYVARFNARDWDGVRELIRDDARLELVGAVEAEGRDFIAGRYLGNYAVLPVKWRMTVGVVDGEEVMLHWRLADGGWRAHSAVRLLMEAGRVVAIRDYIHVDDLLDDADVEGDRPGD